MGKILIILCLVFFGTVGFSGNIDPKKTDTEYLSYGEKHKCVLKILGHYSGEKNIPYNASCVIIDPYHILTAAHVVKNSISQYVVYNNESYNCVKFIIHPDFDGQKVGYNDIAILKLSKPIEIDFYPDLYDGSDEFQKVCSISGFGLNGTLSRGYDVKKSDGKRRAGSNVIAEIDKDLLICSTKDQSTELEFLICPGDSGGGLFIDKKLAGINSCVMAADKKTDSNYGDESGHTRISSFIEWIKNAKEELNRD